MTTKFQLFLRAEHAMPVDAFVRIVDRDVVPRLLERAPSALKMTRTEREPPRLSIVPMRRSRLAMFSVWADDVGFAIDLPRVDGLRWSGYRVEESAPRRYEKTWQDGFSTPGIGLLTTFRARRNLDRHTFLRRWHEGHTPLALSVHPLWSYVRNVVTEPAMDSPALDAIVEEQFREERDLFDPTIFFGGTLAMLSNMVRVGIDITRFIDLRTLENHLVVETHLRSAP